MRKDLRKVTTSGKKNNCLPHSFIEWLIAAYRNGDPQTQAYLTDHVWKQLKVDKPDEFLESQKSINDCIESLAVKLREQYYQALQKPASDEMQLNLKRELSPLLEADFVYFQKLANAPLKDFLLIKIIEEFKKFYNTPSQEKSAFKKGTLFNNENCQFIYEKFAELAKDKKLESATKNLIDWWNRNTSDNGFEPFLQAIDQDEELAKKVVEGLRQSLYEKLFADFKQHKANHPEKISRTFNSADFILVKFEALSTLSEEKAKSELESWWNKEGFENYRHYFCNEGIYETDTFNGMQFIYNKFKELTQQDSETARNNLRKWWNADGYQLYSNHIGKKSAYLGQGFLKFLYLNYQVNLQYYHISESHVRYPCANQYKLGDGAALAPVANLHYNGTNHWSAVLTEDEFQKLNTGFNDPLEYTPLFQVRNNFSNINSARKTPVNLYAALITINPDVEKINLVQTTTKAVELEYSKDNPLHVTIKVPNVKDFDYGPIKDKLTQLEKFTAFEASIEDLKNFGEDIAQRNDIRKVLNFNAIPEDIEEIIIVCSDNSSQDPKISDKTVTLTISYSTLVEYSQAVEASLKHLKNFKKFDLRNGSGHDDGDIIKGLREVGRKIAARNAFIKLCQFEKISKTTKKLQIHIVEGGDPEVKSADSSEEQSATNEEARVDIINIPRALIEDRENFEIFVKALDQLTTITEITYEDEDEEDSLLKKKLNAFGHLIASRNKLLELYNIDTDKVENLWAATMEAHAFRGVGNLGDSAKGTYYYYFRGSNQFEANEWNDLLNNLGKEYLLKQFKIDEGSFEKDVLLSQFAQFSLLNYFIALRNSSSFNQIIFDSGAYHTNEEKVSPSDILSAFAVYLRKYSYLTDATISISCYENNFDNEKILIELKNLIPLLKGSGVTCIKLGVLNIFDKISDKNEIENIKNSIEEHGITTRIVLFEAESKDQIELDNLVAKNQRLISGAAVVEEFLQTFAEDKELLTKLREDTRIPPVHKENPVTWSLRIKATPQRNQQQQQETRHQQQMQQQQSVSQRKQQLRDRLSQLESVDPNSLLAATLSGELIRSTNIADYCNKELFTHFSNNPVKNLNSILGHFNANIKSAEYKITAIHPSAFTVIAANFEDFKFGLNLANLPHGFYLARAGDDTVLCYNEELSRREENPLTLKFNKDNKRLDEHVRYGNFKQFGLEDNVDNQRFNEFFQRKFNYQKDKNKLVEIFKTFLTADIKLLAKDPTKKELINPFLENQDVTDITDDIIENILNPYKSILDTFDSKNYHALCHLLYEKGALGVLSVFRMLTILREHQGERHFSWFKTIFIDDANTGQFGYLFLLASPVNIRALKNLTNLSATERFWFYALAGRHLRTCHNACFSDLVEAYCYFCQQVKAQYHAEIPSTFPFDNLKELNLPLFLDRILILLKRSPNPAKQLGMLNDLDFSFEGVSFAVSHDKFFFVTSDMQISPKTFNGSGGEIRPDQDLSYSIDLTGLQTLAGKATISLDEFKPWFFRYFGANVYHAIESIAELKRAVSEIIDNKTLPLKELDKINLLRIIALINSGENAFEFKADDLKPLLDLIDSIKTEPEKVSVILSTLADWIDLTERPTLQDISAIVYYLSLFKSEEIDTKFTDFLKDNILNPLKADAYYAFRRYQENYTRKNENTRPIDPQVLLEACCIIDDRKDFPLEIRQKLIKVIAVLQESTENVSDRFTEVCNVIQAIIEESRKEETKTLAEYKLNTIEALLEQLASIDLATIQSNDPKKNFSIQVLYELIILINAQTIRSFEDCTFDLTREINIQLECRFTGMHGKLSSHLLSELRKLRQYIIDAKDLIGKNFLTKNHVPKIEELIKDIDEGNIENFLTHFHEILNISAIKMFLPDRKAIKLIIETAANSTVATAFTYNTGDHLEQQKKRLVEIFKNRFCGFFKHPDDLRRLSAEYPNLQQIVDHLSTIQSNWPKDFDEILNCFENNKIQDFFTLEGLKEITSALVKKADKNAPFPVELFKTLFVQYSVQKIKIKGTEEEKINKAEEAIANFINQLLDKKEYSRSQRGQLFEIFVSCLNKESGPSVSEKFDKMFQLDRKLGALLISKLLEATKKSSAADLLDFIGYISTATSKDTEVFSRLVQNYGDDIGSLNLIFRNLDELKKLKPTIISNVVGIISHYKSKDASRVIQIISTIKNNQVIDSTFIENLSKLFETRPYPNAKKLNDFIIKYIASEENKRADLWSQFILDTERDPFGNRNQKENELFDASHIDYALDLMHSSLVSRNGVTDIEAARASDEELRIKLKQQIHYITAIGQKDAYPIYKGKAAKNLNKTEILNCIEELKEEYNRADVSKEEQITSIIKFLALAREVYYRTSADGKFPYTTQLLAILWSLNSGDSRAIAGILTGQGKTLIAALYATVQGNTFDVCTSNSFLAKEGFEEHQDFFKYLGISSAYITAESPKGTYITGGINYAPAADMKLYEAAARLRGEILPKQKRGLFIDEADYVIFDNPTEYRLAKGMDDTAGPYDNPYQKFYPIIFEYINEQPEGIAIQKRLDDKNPKLEVTDIDQIKGYINRKYPGLLEEVLGKRLKDPDVINDQLARWIRATLHALLKLKEDEDFTVDEEFEREENGVNVYRSYAYILTPTGQPDYAATYGNAVHQMLHAKLNAEAKAGKRGERKAIFPYDPETISLSSETSKDLLKSYDTVFAVTGTPGTEEELKELQESYDFTSVYSVPSHQLSQRIVMPPRIAANKTVWHRVLAEEIKHARELQQPILLICKDIEMASALFDYLKTTDLSDDKLQIIKGTKEEDQKRQTLLEKAGQNGCITVSTPVSGRGTDIKLCKDEKEKLTSPFGLCEISVFPSQPRSKEQSDGRAARNGEPGVALEVINLEDLEADYGKQWRAADFYNPEKVFYELRKQRTEDEKNDRKLRNIVGDIRYDIQKEFFDWWQTNSFHAADEFTRREICKLWSKFLEEYEDEAAELDPAPETEDVTKESAADDTPGKPKTIQEFKNSVQQRWISYKEKLDVFATNKFTVAAAHHDAVVVIPKTTIVLEGETTNENVTYSRCFYPKTENTKRYLATRETVFWQLYSDTFAYLKAHQVRFAAIKAFFISYRAKFGKSASTATESVTQAKELVLEREIYDSFLEQKEASFYHPPVLAKHYSPSEIHAINVGYLLNKGYKITHTESTTFNWFDTRLSASKGNNFAVIGSPLFHIFEKTDAEGQTKRIVLFCPLSSDSESVYLPTLQQAYTSLHQHYSHLGNKAIENTVVIANVCRGSLIQNKDPHWITVAQKFSKEENQLRVSKRIHDAAEESQYSRNTHRIINNILDENLLSDTSRINSDEKYYAVSNQETSSALVTAFTRRIVDEHDPRIEMRGANTDKIAETDLENDATLLGNFNNYAVDPSNELLQFTHSHSEINPYRTSDDHKLLMFIKMVKQIPIILERERKRMGHHHEKAVKMLAFANQCCGTEAIKEFYEKNKKNNLSLDDLFKQFKAQKFDIKYKFDNKSKKSAISLKDILAEQRKTNVTETKSQKHFNSDTANLSGIVRGSYAEYRPELYPTSQGLEQRLNLLTYSRRSLTKLAMMGDAKAQLQLRYLDHQILMLQTEFIARGYNALGNQLANDFVAELRNISGRLATKATSNRARFFSNEEKARGYDDKKVQLNKIIDNFEKAIELRGALTLIELTEEMRKVLKAIRKDIIIRKNTSSENKTEAVGSHRITTIKKVDELTKKYVALAYQRVKEFTSERLIASDPADAPLTISFRDRFNTAAIEVPTINTSKHSNASGSINAKADESEGKNKLAQELETKGNADLTSILPETSEMDAERPIRDETLHIPQKNEEKIKHVKEWIEMEGKGVLAILNSFVTSFFKNDKLGAFIAETYTLDRDRVVILYQSDIESANATKIGTLKVQFVIDYSGEKTTVKIQDVRVDLEAEHKNALPATIDKNNSFTALAGRLIDVTTSEDFFDQKILETVLAGGPEATELEELFYPPVAEIENKKKGEAAKIKEKIERLKPFLIDVDFIKDKEKVPTNLLYLMLKYDPTDDKDIRCAILDSPDVFNRLLKDEYAYKAQFMQSLIFEQTVSDERVFDFSFVVKKDGERDKLFFKNGRPVHESIQSTVVDVLKKNVKKMKEFESKNNEVFKFFSNNFNSLKFMFDSPRKPLNSVYKKAKCVEDLTKPSTSAEVLGKSKDDFSLGLKS